MQVATRRLIIISAISIAGAAAGIALGNFAAGGQKRSGLEELAAYNQIFSASENRTAADEAADPGFASQSGPTGYQCEGCDAHLYNDAMVGNGADTTPMPPYQPEEGVVVAPPPRVLPPSVPGVVTPRPGPLAADRPRTVPSPSTPVE